LGELPTGKETDKSLRISVNFQKYLKNNKSNKNIHVLSTHWIIMTWIQKHIMQNLRSSQL